MLKKDLKSKSVAKDERPYFFKVLHPQMSVDQLRIPPEFRKHIREDLPQRGRLRVTSEGIWSVRVVKEEKEIILKDGWSNFVQDNSLGNAEFLLFTYKGNLSFKVEIFDKNGVKRVRRSVPGTSQQTVVRVVDQVKQEDHFGTEGVQFGTDVLLEQCQNAAKSFTSEFPFFERCMKSYNVQMNFILNIPKPFAREHFPDEKTEFLLRNEQGKGWKVKYAPYQAYCSFTGGWKAFAQDNELKEDDICIFELVREKELKVYIYLSG